MFCHIKAHAPLACPAIVQLELTPFKCFSAVCKLVFNRAGCSATIVLTVDCTLYFLGCKKVIISVFFFVVILLFVMSVE